MTLVRTLALTMVRTLALTLALTLVLTLVLTRLVQVLGPHCLRELHSLQQLYASHCPLLR